MILKNWNEYKVKFLFLSSRCWPKLVKKNVGSPENAGTSWVSLEFKISIQTLPTHHFIAISFTTPAVTESSLSCPGIGVELQRNNFVEAVANPRLVESKFIEPRNPQSHVVDVVVMLKRQRLSFRENKRKSCRLGYIYIRLLDFVHYLSHLIKSVVPQLVACQQWSMMKRIRNSK